MKWKCTYLPGEEALAAAGVAALRGLYPRAKVRARRAEPPYRQLYLTTREGSSTPD